MFKLLDHYQILGLGYNASSTEIVSAYDFYSAIYPASIHAFFIAFSSLLPKKSRLEYDMKLSKITSGVKLTRTCSIAHGINGIVLADSDQKSNIMFLVQNEQQFPMNLSYNSIQVTISDGQEFEDNKEYELLSESEPIQLNPGSLESFLKHPRKHGFQVTDVIRASLIFYIRWFPFRKTKPFNHVIDSVIEIIPDKISSIFDIENLAIPCDMQVREDFKRALLQWFVYRDVFTDPSRRYKIRRKTALSRSQ